MDDSNLRIPGKLPRSNYDSESPIRCEKPGI